MKTVFIEVEHSFNWGKFCVAQFDAEEWARPSAVGLDYSLLGQRGWDSRQHFWVMDLQTGEGACFRIGGLPAADLRKHQVWVCPMFEPFLAWLYQQDLTDLDKLPRLVKLTEADAPGALAGYRREGPSEAERKEAMERTKCARVKS